MIGAVLLAAALAAGAAVVDPAPPAPAARAFRVTATAGPAFVRQDDDGEPNALALGTGFQAGSNSWLRFTCRWEVLASRAGGASQHTTLVLFGVKLQHRPTGWPAWPYVFVGTGYGTAPDYSDFTLPAAAEMGLGAQFALPGGQEVFLEAAVLSANERTITPIRLGVLLP